MSAYLDSDRQIFVMIGPSGVGKSAIAEALASDPHNLVEVTPTWTTRPRRADEAHDINHRFVDLDEFRRVEEAGGFVETVQLFGQEYWYGMPRIVEPALGRAALVLLRAFLLDQLPAHYHNHTVYQIEAELDDARSRMIARGHSGNDLAERLSIYQSEVELGRKAAQRVFKNTGELAVTVSAVAAAITEDRIDANA